MPKPEGYRKALRVMKLAEKFGRIVLSFIDTPGAYPGIDAEERGQAEAIAYNLREMAKLKVPVIVEGDGHMQAENRFLPYHSPPIKTIQWPHPDPLVQ